MKKDGFWSVMVYILTLFCLKNVHCLPIGNNDSAARWLIARGGGGIYISSRKCRKDGTRYSSVGVYCNLKC